MKSLSEQTITNMSDFQTISNSSYAFKRNYEINEIKKSISTLLSDFGLKGLDCVCYYNNFISICGKNYNGFTKEQIDKIITDIIFYGDI